MNVRLALAGPNVTTANTWAAAGAGAPTASKARAAYFDGVYDLRYWSWGGAADTDSDSGRGSSTAATAGARSWLRAVVDGYGARSVLDVACGDARWVSRVDLPVGGPRPCEARKIGSRGPWEFFQSMAAARDRTGVCTSTICHRLDGNGRVAHWTRPDEWEFRNPLTYG